MRERRKKTKIRTFEVFKVSFVKKTRFFKTNLYSPGLRLSETNGHMNSVLKKVADARSDGSVC